MEWLFWISTVFLVYVYCGFPLILWLRGLRRTTPLIREEIQPTVSIIIAAYNEADCISNKLKNTFALEYPADLFEVIVASDGSSDETESIVRNL